MGGVIRAKAPDAVASRGNDLPDRSGSTLRSVFDWMSNPNMRRALGWVGSMSVVAALALSFLAAPASAKGASKIVIQGPGLVHPITVEPGEPTSTDKLWPLM